MRQIIIIGAILLSFYAYSDDDIEHKKQEKIERLDAEIEALQSAKTCFAGAKDAGSYKACHANLQTTRKELYAQRRKNRAEVIDSRVQKLQEQKEKLDKNSKK